ncbi:MAG: hypothetical protein PVI78_11655 [Anaerolineales bacterium]
MATRKSHKLVSKLGLLLLALVIIYLGIGLGFHFGWKSAQAACREARLDRGEFVEPEVFWAPLGLAFDITFWPVYAWANLYHDGTPFATPCTH